MAALFARRGLLFYIPAAKLYIYLDATWSVKKITNSSENMMFMTPKFQSTAQRESGGQEL